MQSDFYYAELVNALQLCLVAYCAEKRLVLFVLL